MLVVITALMLVNSLVTGIATRGAVGVVWSLLMLPAGLIYAVYVTASILICATVVAHLRRRPPPPVPLLPVRWQTHPRTYLVLGTCVVLLTLLREGAFSPAWVLDYYAATTEERVTRSRSATHIATKGGNPSDVMAGRPVHCALECVHPGPSCQAVVASLSCREADPTPGMVMVRGTVSTGPELGLGCYWPLAKRSHVSLHAELELQLQTARTHTTAWFDADITLDSKSRGIQSCYHFRQMVAQELAEQLAKVIQAGLDEN